MKTDESAVSRRRHLGRGRIYVISSPMLALPLDQGMAAMPWARSMVETIENFILEERLVNV